MVKDKVVSGAELAALIATARQDANRNRYRVQVTDDGQNLVLPPPTPIVPMGGIGNDGLLYPHDSAGRMPVVEQNSASINANASYTYRAIGGLKELANAAGASLLTLTLPGWQPVPSVVGGGCVITADGAGNIGAAADVIAAMGATYEIDADLILQVDTTGSYTTKWCENAAVTPAPGTPDYHTAGHIAYLVAGYPYMLRLMCDTADVSLGYDTGVNGNWPNGAIMYISGYYRGL